MPLPPRLFPGDEELGKKDDDHKPGAKSPLEIAWQHRRIAHGPHRRNAKRAAVGIVVLIVLYYFFKNMPTDLENPRPRPRFEHNQAEFALDRPPPSEGVLQKLDQISDASQHSFGGPIKFYQLATSLHAVSGAKGSDSVNRNVLFAAASLKSASILLPIACEMAIRERNSVHFALMGRDDISMDILRSVNGVTKECKIIYHDARPDFSVQSTDFRMEVSCSAGFNHINTFVHPQATFIDASGVEEHFFMKGLKDRAKSLARTVIELPENAEQTLMWTTLLDSSSLSSWNKASIDILVHAPVLSSGSLMRLLDSLKQADFFSSAPPRLTIELPHNVDKPTLNYLEHFKWPPDGDQASGNLLAIHHRIPQQTLTADENSIRFLESFWPAEPFTSHVLVLSPQVELSPLFFHYLKYTMLAYKYADITSVDESLLGISLDLPSTTLNDSNPFSPPLLNAEVASPFIWQAPNSNAALYFGDKWVELHDFVAQLLSSQHELPTPTTLNSKLVSKIYPSWMEHVLKLARTRGYYMLYPNFEDAEGLATLHNELYQSPEEFSKPEEQPSSEELTADPASQLSLKHKEASLITKSLLSILPLGANLPKVSEMPSLSWDGERVSHGEIKNLAESYREIFRRELGGCGVSAGNKPRLALAAGDLFCMLDAKAKKGNVAEQGISTPVDAVVR